METLFTVNEPTTPSPASPDPDRPNAPASDLGARPSYVKLAMRNMVRKRGTSLKHFFLTTAGLLAFLVGVSYLTR